MIVRNSVTWAASFSVATIVLRPKSATLALRATLRSMTMSD